MQNFKGVVVLLLSELSGYLLCILDLLSEISQVEVLVELMNIREFRWCSHTLGSCFDISSFSCILER